MYPLLVESNIRSIMNKQLNQCKETKFLQNTIIFNFVTGSIIIAIITILLYIKYKGKQDIRGMQEKENKKRDYIISKLQFYQKMKSKEFTNIPI